MTERTAEVSKTILAVLATWEDPAPEPVIFGQVANRLHGLLMSEFDDAIAACQAERWIDGINDKLKGRLWSITNKGQSARRK